MSLESDIKQQALELGFDAVGITDAAPIDADHVERLRAWLNAGLAGQMGDMHRNFKKRINPSLLLQGAQSIIVVALNYKPPQNRARADDSAGPSGRGRVARYALYEDYHPFMKKRMGKLAEFIRSAAGKDMRFKICVDSAPLAERALAVRAGLGFIGKNHMLTSPALGPEVFLGEIVTTVKLKPDKPVPGQCSRCGKCLDACPTGALLGDGRFDAGRCISYLTIEHKGQINSEQAAGIGDRLFGCDECVTACPHRENAPAAANSRIKFYPERAELDLNHIFDLNAEAFEREFTDSAIKRLGLERLKRNARICAANSANARTISQ
jgi:epoxyqueuosine reductase